LVQPFHLSGIVYRDVTAVQMHAEAAGVVATQHGFPIWRVAADALHGWALCAQGQAETGMAQIRQTLAFYHDANVQLLRTYFLALLAKACWVRGQVEEGLEAVAEALALVDRTGDRWYEAELYRLKGELLSKSKYPVNDKASIPQACLQKAIELARHQQARSWELRAATSLARLWQSQGKRQEAHDLLAPVYGWFTEGFDTADLQEARALLDELGG
jgi:predicted ATPase